MGKAAELVVTGQVMSGGGEEYATELVVTEQIRSMRERGGGKRMQQNWSSLSK